ncbi:MAG: FHA domain-containing protein [Verrucomicrobiota bacterium]
MRAEGLSAGGRTVVVAADDASAARRERRAPGAAVSVRGRLVSVLPNGQDDRVFWLESEQVDIGRKEGEIRIDDPQLAPRHARLNVTLGGALLTPLDRRNGIYLRLRSVIELRDGDSILLGHQVLRFETVPEHERQARPAIEDGVVLFGTPAPAAWGRLRQLTSSGLGRDLYHLAHPEISLGRDQADLVFSDDSFLSRRHAHVTILKGKPVLQDLGSSNGTYIRLRAPQVLVPGDMIRLGDQLLRFELG